MTANKTIYTWCFSHGTMHTFGVVGAWCTADWIDLGANSEESARRIKRAHFGDARFINDLPLEGQEAVMEQVREREKAA
jgi:hypothetical protein